MEYDGIGMRNTNSTASMIEKRLTDKNDVKNLTHEIGNLFDSIPTDVAEELLTTILQASGFRIERIISQGQLSPPGFWYDQDENEWVIVLQGAAAVQFDGDIGIVHLQPGSYLNIPAHVKHRVAWTEPNQKTVWLAIYYRDRECGE